MKRLLDFLIALWLGSSQTAGDEVDELTLAQVLLFYGSVFCVTAVVAYVKVFRLK